MRPDSITLAIFEKYSPEELVTTAQNLVQALADKETAETEKKVSDAVFKERINKHEAEATEHAKRYSKGGETAQIGCDIRYDTPELGKKSYIRMDRNEVVETHDMTWEERQETLQFPLTSVPEPSPEQVNEALANISEEVTAICPYPGCIGWDQHDGDHIFPKPAVEAKTDSASPEVQAQPEREKKTRKRKPHAPPPEPPQPPAPRVGH